MSKLDDETRLRHMLDAAEQAQRFMQGKEQDALDTDPMLRLAVVKTLEIIGEAAAKVSKERQASMPGHKWSVCEIA
jgi:uncharacterized protein with HEPN domain